MNLFSHLLAMILAQAQPVPSMTPAPPRTGLTVSVAAGVGVESGTGSYTLADVSKSLPFTLAAGYRFDPRWSADLNLTYAPIIVASDCPDSSDRRLGAALRWHRPSQRIVRPWISLGLGYDKFRHGGGGYADVELTGFDLDFQVGGDVRLSPAWSVGPFASARVGTYVHSRWKNHDRSGAGGPVEETVSFGDLTRHEWFSIGLRGTFDSGSTSTASAEGADYRSGLLFMPFLGVHQPAGDSFGTGFRAGFLAGHHVWPAWSVNGELAVDFMNVNNAAGWGIRARVADLVLAPLYHLQIARGEIVVGPRLGGFRLSMTSGSGRQEIAHGLAYGLNVGVFGTVGDMAMGALIGYTRRHSVGTGLFGQDDIDSNGQRAYKSWSAPDVSSLTFAALF